MNISKIIKEIKDPKPYVKGTDVLWTDPHISTFLLKEHLDPDIGSASRTFDAIDDTVKMIHARIAPGSKILDLGCGPGLYAERLAKLGHYVTGVDFSKNSIDYAKKQRDIHLYNIDYIHENYLNLDMENEFDLVMMVYCDFGVLIPDERKLMVEIIRKALKPQGIFVFDSITEDCLERLRLGMSWELVDGGFFSPEPYICLNNHMQFPEEKAVLNEYIVINENSDMKLFRFWNHYYDVDDVKRIFFSNGFSSVEVVEALLKGDGPYNDSSVAFYIVSK